ncbi:MAG: hypothetical protein JWL94_1881 [Microbacteriaceae bacterium]|nr:hypothetical protein [Microbacteriaceae bacterium]
MQVGEQIKEQLASARLGDGEVEGNIDSSNPLQVGFVCLTGRRKGNVERLDFRETAGILTLGSLLGGYFIQSAAHGQQLDNSRATTAEKAEHVAPRPVCRIRDEAPVPMLNLDEPDCFQ